MTKKSISGMQPTSDLHIGNYLGAIKSWLSFVDSGYDAFAFIADLHAITVFQDPKKLKESIKLSIDYVHNGIKNRFLIGKGHNPINHFADFKS